MRRRLGQQWRAASLIVPLLMSTAAANEFAAPSDTSGPTYHVAVDGTVDWSTFNGFRRYGASCLHCHGADGLGSTFAPSMTEALKTMSYADFIRIVETGETSTVGGVQSVMPPFGNDPNVKCHMDDIYIYLKARSDGALPRGRPVKKQPQSESDRQAEEQCLRSFGLAGQ
jgi:methanol metabolism-related c-type cytochrome